MSIPSKLSNATISQKVGQRITNLLAPYFRDLLGMPDFEPCIVSIDVDLNTSAHMRMLVNFHCLPDEVIFKALMAYVESNPTKLLDDAGEVIVTAELKNISIGYNLVSGFGFTFDFFGAARTAVGRGFARVFKDV
jgi:hypothetical protein